MRRPPRLAVQEQEKLLREKEKADARVAKERERELARLEAERRKHLERMMKEQARRRHAITSHAIAHLPGGHAISHANPRLPGGHAMSRAISRMPSGLLCLPACLLRMQQGGRVSNWGASAFCGCMHSGPG